MLNINYFTAKMVPHLQPDLCTMIYMYIYIDQHSSMAHRYDTQNNCVVLVTSSSSPCWSKRSISEITIPSSDSKPNNYKAKKFPSQCTVFYWSLECTKRVFLHISRLLHQMNDVRMLTHMPSEADFQCCNFYNKFNRLFHLMRLQITSSTYLLTREPHPCLTQGGS